MRAESGVSNALVAVLWLWIVGSAGAVHAQAPAVSAPPSCASPEHRQFDFWRGAWEVSDPAGKIVGRSRVDAILDDCVLLENWTSATAFAGKSFNLYNAANAHWEQFWVDQTGSRLHLVGGLVNGAMVLQGVQDQPNAKTKLTQRERITWTPHKDGSVRQLWETSNDDGASWKVSFDGLYRRASTAVSK